jgi:hypothetical protein
MITNDDMMDLALNGVSIVEIGRRACVSRQRVSKILIKMGMPRSKGPRTRFSPKDTFRHMYDAGLCDLEIARQTGWSQSCVFKWRSGLGLPTVGERIKQDRLAEMKAMRERGMTLEQVGKVFWPNMNGSHTQAAWNYMNRNSQSVSGETD